MTEILEADADFGLDESGLVVHRDQNAINQRIRFWAEKIGRGEFWGKPEKGNNLKSYQFRAPDDFLFSLLEMEIVEDLPRQVPVQILSIRCRPATRRDKHTYVTIIYQDMESGELGMFGGNILENKS